VRRASVTRCQLLVVVAEHDTMAPTGAALTVAARAPLGELYRSRGRHDYVYAGGHDHEHVLPRRDILLAPTHPDARPLTSSRAPRCLGLL
jgi:hypothetical protein